MIRHPKGEILPRSLIFHSPLIIPHLPVTFAKMQCIKTIPVRGLIKKMSISYFDGERFTISVRLFATQKNLVHDNWIAKCDATVCQTPHIFSDSPCISM